MSDRNTRAVRACRRRIIFGRFVCYASLSIFMLLPLASAAQAQQNLNWDANGRAVGNGGTGTFRSSITAETRIAETWATVSNRSNSTSAAARSFNSLAAANAGSSRVWKRSKLVRQIYLHGRLSVQFID